MTFREIKAICNEVQREWSEKYQLGGFDGIYTEYAIDVVRKVLAYEKKKQRQDVAVAESKTRSPSPVLRLSRGGCL